MPVPQSQTYGIQQAPVKEAAGNYKLDITRVTPLWPKNLYVQWVLRNPTAGSGYFFNVYRSGSTEGPWETIAEDLADTYFYFDDSFAAPVSRTTPDLFSLRRVLYYKVTMHMATPTVLAENVRDLGITIDHRRQGILRKLSRDAYIALKRGSGTRVAVLKRKWWGEPCPKCRALTGQSTRAHCATCKGTGVTVGYWNPVYTYAQRVASPNNMQIGVQGQIDINRQRVLIPNVPQLDPLDILVFLQDNKRFLVENISGTEIHTSSVHQEVDVTELSRSSVEYNLLVDPWREPKWY